MAPRRYAALTMVRDEDFFLRIWHRYYAAAFGAENLFIVDHNSSRVPPRDVVGAQANILRLSDDGPVGDPDGSKRLFDDARFKALSAQIAMLLNYYDCVILGDVDELYIARGGLRAYLDSLPDISIRAGMGIEVLHDIGSEPEYDLGKPLFAQRSCYRYRLNFCKPWVLSKPAQVTGHGCYAPFHLDPNLMLLHLHYLDHTNLMARQQRRLADFDAGRGGKRSRWKNSLIDTHNSLEKMLAHEADDRPLPHASMLERFYPGYQDQPFTHEAYPRQRGPANGPIEVEKAATIWVLRQFRDRLRRFPEWMAEVEV